jgi:adenosylmethionine-8-amino-7-oxononanoate aminotransferase
MVWTLYQSITFSSFLFSFSLSGGNPLACAAALATIKILKEEGLGNADKAGKYFLVRFFFQFSTTVF